MSEMSFLENSSSEDERTVDKRKSVENKDSWPSDRGSISDFELDVSSDEADTTLVPSNPACLIVLLAVQMLAKLKFKNEKYREWHMSINRASRGCVKKTLPTIKSLLL